MKKASSAISGILFACIFALGSVSSTFDSFSGYFGFHSTSYILIRYVIIFALVFLFTALASNMPKFISLYSSVIIVCVSAFMLIDYYFLKLLCHNFAYLLWLFAALCVSCSSLFFSASCFFKENYKEFFRIFWNSFTPIYFFIIIFCFIREPNSFGGLTVNNELFNGTIKYFKAILQNPDNNQYTALICLGNFFILTPLPFIIRNLFKKTFSSWTILLIGVILPFLFEIYQYVFKCGDVDIDDIVLNITGFLIGYIIEEIIYKKKLRITP